MKKSLLVLFAIAGGFAVGNLYFVQPLLARISEDLGTSTVHNGWLITSVQLGYVTGIMFLLPLGDVVSRKKFVPVMMTIAGLGQLSISQSTNFTWLAISFVLVGFSTIAGQILIPLTNELSDDSNRGRNSSFVVSGMIIGILAARAISGTLSDLITWHGTFAVIGLANILLAWTLYNNIPITQTQEKIPYVKLVSGVFSLWKKNPWVLRVMFNNSMSMMVFSATWTSITFLLSAKPYNWSTTAIGLVGLVGIVSASAASLTGRSIDSGKGDRNAAWAFGVAALAMVIGSFAPISLVFLLISLLLREFTGQAIAINNQTKLIGMFPHARSRVNAGYVSINFIGQAIGSILAISFYPLIGWIGIQWLCCGLSLLGLAFWIFNVRTKPAQPVF
jgi:predicted MFS family arabinose efflux permease